MLFHFGTNFDHSIFHRNTVQLSPGIDASMMQAACNAKKLSTFEIRCVRNKQLIETEAIALSSFD